jgi:hypothetical protein
MHLFELRLNVVRNVRVLFLAASSPNQGLPPEQVTPIFVSDCSLNAPAIVLWLLNYK